LSAGEEERAGLCFSCRNVRRIRSDRGSLFYRCQKADTDPRFARFPVLPIKSCAGYKPEPSEPEENTVKVSPPGR
jgi:hypothetical protein